MIDTYLFLPDNLMSILYEEQKLIQQIVDFPFKTPFPMFKTKDIFPSLEICPPIAVNQLIIRPCKFYAEMRLGFVLGNAKTYEEACNVIKQIEDLKKLSSYPVFTKLACKAWYYAKIEFVNQANTKLTAWTILEKKWVKSY